MPRPRNVVPNFKLRQNRYGVWSVYWTEDGRTRSVSTGEKDRREADRWLAQYIAGRSAHVVAGPTIGAIMDGYLAAKTEKASYSSLLATANILRPRFGDLEPRHVTQAIVKQHADERVAQGRSRSTVYNDLLILRAMVNWAIKQKIIPPTEKLTFETPIQRSKPRDRWLTKEEAARLVAACKAPHIRLFVILGLTTGARRDAILELTWDRVDLSRRRIDFGEGNGNKRKSVVPINDTLLAELTTAKEAAVTDRVVEYGGHHVADIRRGLESAAARAGVGHVHPHLLRHTAATHMVMAGVPTVEVARYLGMTEAMVERVYGKHSPEYLSRAARALDF